MIWRSPRLAPILAAAAATLALSASAAQAQGWSSTYTYAYDSLGRVTSVTRPDGSTTTYTYDAAGNRVAVSNTAPLYHNPATAHWVVLPLGGMLVIPVYPPS